MNTQNINSPQMHFLVKHSREIVLSLAVISTILSITTDGRWIWEAVSLIVLGVLLHLYVFQKRAWWLFWIIVAMWVPIFTIGIPLLYEAFFIRHLSTLEFVLVSMSSLVFGVTFGALVAVWIWAQTKETFPQFTERIRNWRRI